MRTPHPRRTPPGAAFTLIELLVVIVIFGILSAILFPVLGSAMRKGKQTIALNNMRQVGNAFILYAQDHDGSLPVRPTDGSGTPTDKWPRLLAPYLGFKTDTPDNPYGAVQALKVYLAPITDGKDAEAYRKVTDQELLANDKNNTSFILNGFNDKSLPTDPGFEIKMSQIATPGQLILLGTPKPKSTHFYMDFADKDNYDVLNLAAFAGGSNYLFADGSAQFIKETDYKKPHSDTVTVAHGDWLWLVDKTRTDVIQPPK